MSQGKKTGTIGTKKEQGYCFIKPDETAGGDIFAHLNAFVDKAAGFDRAVSGETRVEYELEEGRNGKMQACNVEIIEG